MKELIIKLGKILFNYRTLIAVPFFILLVILSRPVRLGVIPCLAILIGLLIRFWAAGYIGEKARAAKFTAQYRIINGPYKFIKHPLYLGNFFLVLGVILLFNPVIWFAVIIIALFLLFYSLMIVSEMDHLKDLPKKISGFALTNCKGEISTLSVVLLIFLIYIIWLKLLYR